MECCTHRKGESDSTTNLKSSIISDGHSIKSIKYNNSNITINQINNNINIDMNDFNQEMIKELFSRNFE